MSLFTDRPTHPNQVVGQEHVRALLDGILAHPRYMTRGFIFSGPWGIGKTTLAYLFAKALICADQKGWDCPGCWSCKEMPPRSSQTHPNFLEMDGASFSLQGDDARNGVERARTLISRSEELPTNAHRRVILIDEAHRLSKPAWEVFLHPLEIADTNCCFLFCTTQPESIPRTIVSRSTAIPLSLVTEHQLVGMIAAIADRERVTHTLAGLKRIASLARGKPRDALRLFQTVMMTGAVTPENIARVVVEDTAEVAIRIYRLLISSSHLPDPDYLVPLVEAFRMADERAQLAGAKAMIDGLFRCYIASVFEGGIPASEFPDWKKMQEIFLRWSISPDLPIECLSLVLMELCEQLSRPIAQVVDPEERPKMGLRPRSTLVEDNTMNPDRRADRTLSVQEFKQMLGVL